MWDGSHCQPCSSSRAFDQAPLKILRMLGSCPSCVGWTKAFVYTAPETGSREEGNANKYVCALLTWEQFFPLLCWSPAQPMVTQQFQRVCFWGPASWIHCEQMENNWYNLILLAQELVSQDCSSHSAENQRPTLPGGVDLTLSPCSSLPLSFSHF